MTPGTIRLLAVTGRAGADLGENWALGVSDGMSDSRADIPSLSYDGSHPITLEFWIPHGWLEMSAVGNTDSAGRAIVLRRPTRCYLIVRGKDEYGRIDSSNDNIEVERDAIILLASLTAARYGCTWMGNYRFQSAISWAHMEPPVTRFVLGPVPVGQKVSQLITLSTASSTKFASQTSPATPRISHLNAVSSRTSTQWRCITSTKARGRCCMTVRGTGTTGRSWGRSG